MATFKIKKLLFCFLLIGGFVALGKVMLRPLPFSGPIGKRAPNIYLPDALIRSHSLSKLPPDLLRIPLARDVLTEDFVAYYEQNENRLALSGTLRRIAFEHKLNFPERVLESVFNEPAEVALWRDDAGRLKDFVLVLSCNHLARAIQILLPAVVKATDIQLSSAGRLDGTDVEILALEYGFGHHLLLLSKGDRIVALSNPAMLLTGERKEGSDARWPQLEKAVEIIRELLEGGETVSPFARHFFLRPLADQKHELTLGARAFALNYETFVPGLEALSFAFDDQGKWQSATLLDGAAWGDNDNRKLWAALPHGASFCAALPVDWAQMASVLKKFNARQEQRTDPKEFTASFTGPAAVCWYGGSRLYTPLFAAHLNVGADEKKVQEFFDLVEQATKAEGGEISTSAENGSALWQGEIASRFGSPNDGGKRRLKPALAIQGNIVFFSPDTALVENALAVAAKRYPALSDSFHATKDAPLAFVDPGALASLLREEIFTALPRNEEALFRNAAEAYLVPRLEALARYPAQRIGLSKKVHNSSSDSVWYPLEWKENVTR
ncbi:MAG: DUF2138 family protein [Proteobacteria bacterium]|nr:DUF2138 family protein [Pseudomonadota bacterium]